LMVDFGRRDLVAVAASVQNGPHDRPLLFERVRLRQAKIEGQGGDVHSRPISCQLRGISRSSKVSMTSPGRRSWLLDNPTPHSNPVATSRASSLKRLSEVMLPFQMITPSRRKRTFEP